MRRQGIHRAAFESKYAEYLKVRPAINALGFHRRPLSAMAVSSGGVGLSSRLRFDTRVDYNAKCNEKETERDINHCYSESCHCEKGCEPYRP